MIQEKSLQTMAIAFASGKGGTGKTSLSVNLAAYLSCSREVLLADLDVDEPDAALFLANAEKIQSDPQTVPIAQIDTNKCTKCGKCVSACNYNAIAVSPLYVKIFPELCKSCFRCRRHCPEDAISFREAPIGEISQYRDGNLTLYEGKLRTGDIHTKHLIHLVKSEIRKSDVALRIYDCPPGTTCPMVESVKGADYTVLVTEPTPFGLHDLMLAVEVVRSIDIPFGVVINKSDEYDGLIATRCAAEGIPVIARFPFSMEVVKKAGNGRLVYDVSGYAENLDLMFQRIQEDLS